MAEAEVATDALPTVARLAALWRRVRRRPLWAPPHFWRWVRLRRTTSLRLLSADEVGVLGPPAPLGKVNDCANCLNTCCVGPLSTVLLNLRDIAALVDLGREGLIQPDKPSFPAATQAARPALARLLASRAWRVFPVLAKDAMGACRALTPLGRCGLFPHWPLACARFPYSLDVEEAEVFYSPRCPSFWVRPGGAAAAAAMKAAAVAAYNARIQDAILLHVARDELAAMGLLGHLRLGG